MYKVKLSPTGLLRAVVMALAIFCMNASPSLAVGRNADKANEVLHDWYGLILELVRHTATYSPPIASRSFAYVGVTSYEVAASGNDKLQSLSGQLNALGPLPAREKGKVYDEAVVMDAALAFATEKFFFNTGPTGQRALAAMERKMRAKVMAGVPRPVALRSVDYGKLMAQRIFDWSQSDGGAVVENMGFPLTYTLTKGPAHWVPTSTINVQQAPLLPNWGKTRSFAMPNGASCKLPPPPEYSEDKTSDFFKQALEVYETRNGLLPEQKAIARFWSDDPMLSTTPPGHWVEIALSISKRDKLPLDRTVDVLARLGVTVADAFIGCWDSKFQYDLIRPVTYIRRTIDKKWDPLLITPPFPEYPSGHSTQSGAAATVLTQFFGEKFAFDDASHERDGLKARHFNDFWSAAEEAALSRLYGGIHFRAAIERGLDQGRCVGAFANALNTRKK